MPSRYLLKEDLVPSLAPGGGGGGGGGAPSSSSSSRTPTEVAAFLYEHRAEIDKAALGERRERSRKGGVTREGRG